MGPTPLFWAPLDVAFLTEASALPRIPAQLPLTVHSWNPLLNTGTHYNVTHTTLLIFAPQAFLQWLGLSAALTQRLIAVVFFVLPGLALYALVRAVLGRDGWTLRGQGVAVVAASFYMFNLYLENVRLSLNMSALTAQTTLPALLALMIHAFDGRLGRRRFVSRLAPAALAAGRATDILLHDMEFEPGANKLRLYTPFPGTPVGNHRHLTFGLREGSVHAGRVQFTTSIHVPFPGAYQLEVRPYGREAGVTVGSIALDARIVELEAGDRLGEPTFSTVVDLDAGLHRIELDQQGSEQYAFRLSPVTGGSAASPERSVEVLERSPTSLTASVVTEGPAMLVFGESFDPRWTATVEGRELPHHTVNGFANGYELPGPGSYEVTLRFGPQSAFVSGAAISLASLGVIGAVAIGPAIWRRARARRTPAA